jgi:hypothetical protein
MPSLQDIVNKATGGVSGPQSVPQSRIPVQGPIQPTPEPVAPTPASEPSIISSSQGGRVVNETAKQLAAVEGAPPVDPTTGETTKETGAITTGAPDIKTAPPTTETKQEDYVTYVNPETGAEKTLRGDAISDAARNSLEKSGWVVSEETSTKSSAMTQAEQQRKTAETELNSVMDQLQQSTVSDKDLRQTVSTIRGRYNSRMRQMEEINRRREQTLNTLGVRLGSRYTGGSGGVFGGILAEEERQGIERVTAIEGEMLAAISAAKKAAKDHNYGVFVKMTELAQKKFDDKQKAVEDLKKVQEAKDKEIKEEANLVANQSAVIEQIQGGMKTPADIFAALGGTVPFDVIKEITDTLPDAGEVEQFTLGRYDVRYDSTGRLIARGTGAGGGAGGTDISGVSSFGAPVVSVGTPIVQGIGTSYKNSTSEAQMLIDDILNKIPVQLRNTEVETELKKEQIRKQLAAGYTYQQVVDRLSGFSLQGDKADKPLGEALYNAALGTDTDLGQLASLINRGAGEQAMSLVENKQLESADGFFAGTDKARATIKQADVVLKLLADPTFPKDKLGAFDGRKFKLGRFAGLTDQETLKIQQLETALQLLASPIRVEVAGTAATDSEMAKISAFQSDILDQPDIIKTQVTGLRDSVVNFHNEARSQRGLPTVDDKQLIDNKARLNLYRELGGVNEGMVMNNLDNSSFLNSWGGFEPAKANTDDNKSFFDNQ